MPQQPTRHSRPFRVLQGACSVLGRSLSARVASRGERPRYAAIQAPRLRFELLEEDAELLAACATAAQTLLASVDKVRPPPSPPTRHPLKARGAPVAPPLKSIRATCEQVSDRAIEGSGEAGISLKVLYLDQNLHMLQPLWDGAAPPIVLSRVGA